MQAQIQPKHQRSRIDPNNQENVVTWCSKKNNKNKTKKQEKLVSGQVPQKRFLLLIRLNMLYNSIARTCVVLACFWVAALHHCVPTERIGFTLRLRAAFAQTTQVVEAGGAVPVVRMQEQQKGLLG